jgi:hypothetical protein
MQVKELGFRWSSSGPANGCVLHDPAYERVERSPRLGFSSVSGGSERAPPSDGAFTDGPAVRHCVAHFEMMAAATSNVGV